MKFVCSIFIYLLCDSFLLNIYAQSNHVVIKAWAIEETLIGGAPPPKSQKAIFRKSLRFFLETKSDSKVKVIGVYVGVTPFSVLEEHQSKSFPDRDYKPSDFNIKNNFIQVLITDTLRLNSLTIPTDIIKHNQAVIVYLLKSKKQYYLPIKTIVHEHINLP